MFNITKDQAKSIVTMCPNCQKYSLPWIGAGVNPRGFHSLQIWQIDVTHYNPFAKYQCLHVSIDTSSGVIFASLHARETTLLSTFCRCSQHWVFLRKFKQREGLHTPPTNCSNFLICGLLNTPQAFPIPPQDNQRPHGSLKDFLKNKKRE